MRLYVNCGREAFTLTFGLKPTPDPNVELLVEVVGAAAAAEEAAEVEF